MTIPTITTGDDLRLPVQLTIGGASFDASAATITARLVSADHATALTPDAAQSSATPGAAWGTSLIVVVIAGADTAGIDVYGLGYIEIQAETDVKETWFVPVNIVQGQIA